MTNVNYSVGLLITAVENMSPSMATIIKQMMSEYESISLKDAMKMLEIADLSPQYFETPVKKEFASPAFNSPSYIFSEKLLSRYKSDFEQHTFLGRGGFGAVVKARNVIGIGSKIT